MAKRVTDFDQVLGARLRAARIERSLSQQQMGERLDISFQQIQKYENGRNRVSTGRLVEFAKHYDRSVEWFVSGLAAGGDNEPDLGTRALGTAAGRELIEAFLAIDDAEARAALVQMARKLAGTSTQNLQAAE